MVAEVTWNCLTSIQSRDPRAARVDIIAEPRSDENEEASGIPIVGRAGAGKSSTVEDVTGATGMSGNSLEPVNTECKIEFDMEQEHLIDFSVFSCPGSPRIASHIGHEPREPLSLVNSPLLGSHTGELLEPGWRVGSPSL